MFLVYTVTGNIFSDISFDKNISQVISSILLILCIFKYNKNIVFLYHKTAVI